MQNKLANSMTFFTKFSEIFTTLKMKFCNSKIVFKDVERDKMLVEFYSVLHLLLKIIFFL